MKLVAGLGNPGSQYAKTPHNVGFRVVELLAERVGSGFKNSPKLSSEVANGSLNGTDLVLVKPTTFMNNSGLSVSAVMRYRKLDPSDVIIVVDDADLPLGTLRIRPRGSSGGHNGLKSVSAHLGTDDYVRVRFGVGRGETRGGLAGHVLRPFLSSEAELVDSTVSRAADAVAAVMKDGCEAAMNAFNGSADSGQ
jgi:PTH1 family peptidyl-tRNA hydrolase